MNLTITTRDDDQQYLMHYRTRGSKNGVRRFQDEQGHLTSEGYQHYKDMYGWGDKPKAAGDPAKTPGEKKPTVGNAAKQVISKDEYEQKRQESAVEDAAYKKERKAALSAKAPEHVRLMTAAEYKKKDAERDMKRYELEESAGHKVRAEFFRRSVLKDLDESKQFEKDARVAKLGSLNYKDINKQVKDDVKETNAKILEAKARRDSDAVSIDPKTGKEESVYNPESVSKKQLAVLRKNQLREEKEAVKNVRNMSDEDLNKALNRLRLEKQYAELVNERANRERGPIYEMASKLVKDAAQDLAKKSLDVVVNKLVGKISGENDFKLEDFKDKDLMKLDSAKLQKVATAFNNAANIARNKLVIENGGRDPNQKGGDNNQNNGGQPQGNGGKKNTQQPEQKDNKKSENQTQSNDNGEGTTVSKNQRKKMRAMANGGDSVAEIAKRFGVSESTVRNAVGDAIKNNDKPKNETPPQQTQSSDTSSKSEPSKEPDKPKSVFKFDTLKAVKQNSKAVDDFLKQEQNKKIEMSKAEQQKKLDDWVDMINGSKWEEQKIQIQKEDAERKERERQRKLREQARSFGYSW